MADEAARIVGGALEGDAFSAEPPRLDRRAVLALEGYVGELLLAERSMHIVGRSDVAGNMTKQLSDSIALLRFASACAHEGRGRDASGPGPGLGRIADIGSGAGFPGLVWKLVRPELEITLFERRDRMAALLERIAARLGAGAPRIVQIDAMEYDRPRSFDLVVSKAAGSLGRVVPVAARLLAPGGAYCTIKGERWAEELEEPGARALTLERDAPTRSGAGRFVWLSTAPGAR